MSCVFIVSQKTSLSTTRRQLSRATESVDDAVLTANTSTTPNVTDTTSEPICYVSYHFDGMSFIGGMVFALGVVAIFCFFFQARREHRYHTL